MKHAKWWVRICVAGLLGLMAVLAVLSMKDDSVTNDEIAHIAAGYSYLTQQDYRLNPEHPPLVKDLAALPLLFLDLNFPFSHPAWTEKVNGQWELGQTFLYTSGNNTEQIVFWARLPMVFLLVILGLFLYYWAKELGGEKNFFFPLFVLVLFVFCPNFLAHGRLVTTDVAATLGFVAGMYFFLRLLYLPSWQNACILGLALGFALLVKFSIVILLPVFLLVWFLYLCIQGALGNMAVIRKYLSCAGIVILITVLLIGAVYQFHIQQYPAERQMADSQIILGQYYGVSSETVSFDLAQNTFLRPYAQYALGLLRTIARASMAGPDYLLGSTGIQKWYYFPVLYFFKIPLAFHILTLLTIFCFFSFWKTQLGRVLSREHTREKLHKHFTQIAMFCFVVVYGGIAMSSPMHIGFRHLLPIMPFLYLLVAMRVFAWFRESSFISFRKKAILVSVLVAWYILSSISSFPHYLSYYNEAGGGVSEGYKISVDSNYDWGQDLGRFTKWVEDRGIEKIYVDYPSHWGDPSLFETKYILWKGSSLWVLHGASKDDPAKFPKGNYLAVNASHLVSGDWTKSGTPGRDYAWLDIYTPVARPGPSIFVYYIDK